MLFERRHKVQRCLADVTQLRSWIQVHAVPPNTAVVLLFISSFHDLITFSREIKEQFFKGTKDIPVLTYSEGSHQPIGPNTHTLLLTTTISWVGVLITLYAPFFQEDGSRIKCQFIVPLPGSKSTTIAQSVRLLA